MQSKIIFHFLSLSILCLALAGCKKVIQLDLANAAPQIVITGEVNNQTGPYSVNISNSVDFSANNTFPAITGALVTIQGNGILDTLTQNFPGNYISHRILGQPNYNYTLTVKNNGTIYTASSKMPPMINLDSLSVFQDVSRKNKEYYPVAHFQDPLGVANFYAFNVFKNGVILPNGRGKFAFSDRLSDGRYISINLRADSSDFKIGDTATVLMKCIDATVYSYLAQQSNGFGPPNASQTPANPVNNLNNGALGYFSANTVQRKTVVIK